MRMSRGIFCAAAAVVSLVSCGGGDEGESATDEEPAATPENTSEPAAGESAGEEPQVEQPSGDEPATGDNMASVTIDGTTYAVDLSLGPAPQCDPDFFAAFLAAGGDSQGFFYALLPPPDDPNHTDPPNVSLRVNDGESEWIADPSKQMSGVEPGESQVDNFTVDGNGVSGTATFVELNETYAHSGGGPKAQPVTGTFEVSCAG